MSDSKKFCIFSEFKTINSFDISVAVNNKYLIVGYPSENKIVVYMRDDFNQWIRKKEILPPQNSTPKKYGHGFGQYLELSQDTLLITATTVMSSKDVIEPEDFQTIVFDKSWFIGKYIVRLDLKISEKEVQTLDFPHKEISGFDQFTKLSKGKVKHIIIPAKKGVDVGGVALYENNFLVGYSSYYTGGGGLLFDLENSEKQASNLFFNGVYMGKTVALSGKFAAIGDPALFSSPQIDNDPILPRKTLIKALESGATTVIDDIGKLSLSNNILAIMHFYEPMELQTDYLKIFRIDENALPHLISTREDIERGWVQNGFLITISSNSSSKPEICIESIS